MNIFGFIFFSSELSFLDQHFYTDAGVILPEKPDIEEEPTSAVSLLEEHLPNLNINNNQIQGKDNQSLAEEERVSTVSVETIDIENMSDEDLKELETSTTNITDDVKVNLQKINKSKSMSGIAANNVNKRSKRLSCVLPSEQSNLPVPVNLKRRSLNISCGEVSRIPVSFRTRKIDESPGRCRTQIPTPPSKRSSLCDPICAKEIVEKTDNLNDNNVNVNEHDAKENVPMNSIRNDVPISKNGNITKASGLPVLKRLVICECLLNLFTFCA